MQKMAKIQYREEKTNKLSDYNTAFEIQPLERGFGNTLGTALRRTLLSSVSSVAPFAVKISNIEHEFSSLPSVEEDIVTLLDNIKKIKFVYNKDVFLDNTPVRIGFKSTQVGEVSAKDIELPSNVSIINPDQHIATISSKDALNFEVYLISGRGFIDFENNKKRISELGPKLESKLDSGAFLAVDSDFSPIIKVEYKASELNSSAAVVQEKLDFHLQTDGTVEAKEAIAEAAKILMAHLGIIANVENLEINESDFFEEEKAREEQPKVNLADISTLELTIRSYNALKRAGYSKIADLQSLSYEELENIKNLGKKSVQEIVDKLEEHKIELNKGE